MAQDQAGEQHLERAGAGPIDPALCCPRCRGPLERPAGDPRVCCASCALEYSGAGGIWRLLPPDRLAHHARFIRDYEAVRAAEGRHVADPEVLRALPYEDRTGQRAEEWRMRSVSLGTLVAQVLGPMELGPMEQAAALDPRARRRRLHLLDLGSGNGWLSYRLAGRGHDVVAVDLLTHAADGLGAHQGYDVPFTSVQAEFEHLPFATGHFDLAVFNGSVHYSVSYETVLGEALRVLGPEGRLVLMDSPIYHRPESGQAMVRERQEHFLRTLGFASDALPQEGYLTFERLEQLGRTLGIRWEILEPFYGWRWVLRPLKARLLRRREPAKFMLLVACRTDASPLPARVDLVARASRELHQSLWPLRRATWL